MTSIDDLFEEIQRQVDSAPIPACQVAVGHSGAIVAFRSFGQATNSSRFSIFSTTKPIVASMTWLLIGRGETNDLVLEDPMTSRHHARIERRNDNFVLVDQSTNGTFVTVQGERETPLRRSEFILYGHGEIAFGDSPSVRPDIVVIRFTCVATAKNPTV